MEKMSATKLDTGLVRQSYTTSLEKTARLTTYSLAERLVDAEDEVRSAVARVWSHHHSVGVRISAEAVDVRDNGAISRLTASAPSGHLGRFAGRPGPVSSHTPST